MMEGIIKVLEEHVDKNGTKIKRVIKKCSRCGGAGYSDKWMYTGKVCYKCNGDGLEEATIKEYTEEYRKKLDTINKIRNQKKLEKTIEQRKKESLASILKVNGFKNELIYVVRGNTYKIKEELKKHGAKWCVGLSVWYFDIDNENYKLFNTKLIDLMDYMHLSDDGFYFWINKTISDAREKIKNDLNNE